ncbi:MAG: CotH kinase family protein [Saprospiraceae bacterium]|nr:CotH kinase family protein [Saprospiraceae bacterium]MCB9325844.1 CotH kinase family protein [Lewinellaceae bacterium]
MIKRAFLLFAICWTTSLCAQDIYDVKTIQEVKLYFAEGNWDVLLDSLKQAGNDHRLVGTAVINGKRYEKAGIRYKGNSSYFNVRQTGSPKLPLNIKVDFVEKGQELPGGYTTLKLSNIFRDPSYIREVLAYEIVGKYMPAPKANFAKVYVNDEYLGIYNNTESIDEKFLKTYYSEDDGNLIKCDPNWHGKVQSSCPPGDNASLMYLGQDSTCYMHLYELKDKNGWKDIIYLADILNNSPEKIEDILDVDQTLWMHAFNNLTVNLDSYLGRLCHNYYLYRDTLGIFHPLMWDMNLCFGGFRYLGTGAPLSNDKMQTMSPFVHYKEQNEKRPLITQLLTDNLYRKIYAAHLKTMLEENFSNGAYLDRGREIQALISEHVKAEANKLYTLEGFETNLMVSAKAEKSMIIGIAELMAPRVQYLENHGMLNLPQPLISEVTALDFKDFVAVSANIQHTEKAWLYYRHGTFSNFKRIEMFDDGGHNDQVMGDNIWGATVESGKNLQYYIVAEGNATASLSPERASFEFYELGEEE